MQEKKKHVYVFCYSIQPLHRACRVLTRTTVLWLTDAQAQVITSQMIYSAGLFDGHSWLYHNDQLIFDSLADAAEE